MYVRFVCMCVCVLGMCVYVRVGGRDCVSHVHREKIVCIYIHTYI